MQIFQILPDHRGIESLLRLVVRIASQFTNSTVALEPVSSGTNRCHLANFGVAQVDPAECLAWEKPVPATGPVP